MATCDNDHDPITFEGEFRALCPLCAMRLKIAEAEEAALDSAAGMIADTEASRSHIESVCDDLRDKLDKMEEESAGWSNHAGELLDVIKELQVRIFMIDGASDLYEKADEAIHEAERRRKN